MRYRVLGATGLRVSEIGFGTGGVSRLMAEDDPEAQFRAVRDALDCGVTFFDTAAGYGQGRSEANLGRALRRAGAAPMIATKVRLGPGDLADPKAAAIASAEQSLERLGRDAVDLIQIHNYIAPGRRWPIGQALDPEDVLGPGGVLEGFRALRERGKARFFGFTGIGEPEALLRLIESGALHTVQAYFNLLNPSAGHPVPEGFGALDYRCLIDRAAEAGMGVLAIRVLALGALTEEPDLLGFLESPPPLLSPGSDYARDAARAQRLRWLAEGEGTTLARAAIRFALMKPEVSTVLVGFSNHGQLDEAVSASGAPPLPDAAMARLREIWAADFA